MPSGPRFPPPYLPLDLPDRFVIESRDDRGDWIDWAPYRAEACGLREDGSYECHGEGSPTILRCIGYGPGYFLHVDQGGDGDVFAYRLVPLSLSAG
jgi:hypothetical protein